MGSRILFVTTEALPDCGHATAGGGIRAWALGEALESRGHTVEWAFPVDLAERLDLPGERRQHLFTPSNLTEVVAKASPDVAVFEHWFPLSHVTELPCPAAVDLPGPILLENQFRGGVDYQERVSVKLRTLARADCFLYATELQFGYWLPYLFMAGIRETDPPLHHVPISLPPSDRERPDRRGEPLRFLHAGMFWAWADPTPAIDALLPALADHPAAGLTIVGGRHPHHSIEGETYREDLRELGQHAQVEVLDVMPFDRLREIYDRCDVGLNLERVNMERRLSSTIRAVTQLQAGLPIVIAPHSWLRDLVTEYHAGWVMDPEDAAGLRALFDRLLAEPDEARAKSGNARRLVRERLNSHETIEPLHRFCANPRRAKKDEYFFRPLEERIAALEAETATLDREWRQQMERAENAEAGLEEIQNKLVYRIYRKLRGKG